MDPEQQVQQLKDALRDIVMMIAERNQPISPDLRLMLVRVMEHVANRIQEIRGAGAIPPPERPLTPGPYPSSNINSFDYDYDTGELKVKFQGKEVANAGPTYSYAGVPKFIFDIFRKGAVPPKTSGSNRWHTWKKGVTPSLGAAMYHLIRTSYPYQRIS